MKTHVTGNAVPIVMNVLHAANAYAATTPTAPASNVRAAENVMSAAADAAAVMSLLTPVNPPDPNVPV